MDPNELDKALADIKVLSAELVATSKELDRTRESLSAKSEYADKLEAAYNEALAKAKYNAYDDALNFDGEVSMELKQFLKEKMLKIASAKGWV